MSLSNILKSANNSLDADEATVAAHVLNTDLLAMHKLSGRASYTADDVMRLNRIMGEYEPVGRTQPHKPVYTAAAKVGETA